LLARVESDRLPASAGHRDQVLPQGLQIALQRHFPLAPAAEIP
jgi:hypothetical protein